MTPQQLLAAVRKGQAAPAYFFTGPDVRLKREAVEALAALVPEGVRPFNVQVFHAFEDEMSDILTAARTLPFMAPRRVVVLRDIEKTRLDQAGRGELLADYLADLPPESVLVVTTEDDARAKSLVKRHGRQWTVVEFSQPKGEVLAAAVRSEAERLGCVIESTAAAALIEVTGGDRERALSELAKLRSAVGPGGTIDVAAVQRYAAGYVHHGVYDVVDAVADRDLQRSLRLLREVSLKDDEFLGLLGLLAKRLRVLWFLAGGDGAIPAEFRIFPSQLGPLRQQARRFTRAEIERGLLGLERFDESLKSASVPAKLLLEHFLLGMLPRG